MKESTSKLVISVGKLSSQVRYEADASCGADFMLHLSSSDFVDEGFPSYISSNIEFFLGHPDYTRKIGHLTTINLTGAQLNLVLDLLERSFDAEVWFEIYGSRLKGATFGRLVDLSENVTLRRCRLGAGWWNASKSAKCQSLWLYKCSGDKMHGEVANFQISELLVDEGVKHEDLENEISWTWPISDPPASCSNFPSSVVPAFWTEKLKILHAQDCDSISSFKDLPSLPNLEMLYLSGSPTTVEIFDWILKFPRLRLLDLSWKVDVRLPWKHLSRLGSLRSLDLDSTSLDDAQLSEILEHAALKHLEIYDTEVTPASWPNLLAHPSLKTLYASKELAEEPVGKYPESTKLEEFVVMNTLPKFFQNFFARRYPNVTVVSL